MDFEVFWRVVSAAIRAKGSPALRNQLDEREGALKTMARELFASAFPAPPPPDQRPAVAWARKALDELPAVYPSASDDSWFDVLREGLKYLYYKWAGRDIIAERALKQRPDLERPDGYDVHGAAGDHVMASMTLSTLDQKVPTTPLTDDEVADVSWAVLRAFTPPGAVATWTNAPADLDGTATRPTGRVEGSGPRGWREVVTASDELDWQRTRYRNGGYGWDEHPPGVVAARFKAEQDKAASAWEAEHSRKDALLREARAMSSAEFRAAKPRLFEVFGSTVVMQLQGEVEQREKIEAEDAAYDALVAGVKARIGDANVVISMGPPEGPSRDRRMSAVHGGVGATLEVRPYYSGNRRLVSVDARVRGQSSVLGSVVMERVDDERAAFTKTDIPFAVVEKSQIEPHRIRRFAHKGTTYYGAAHRWSEEGDPTFYSENGRKVAERPELIARYRGEKIATSRAVRKGGGKVKVKDLAAFANESRSGLDRVILWPTGWFGGQAAIGATDGHRAVICATSVAHPPHKPVGVLPDGTGWEEVKGLRPLEVDDTSLSAFTPSTLIPDVFQAVSKARRIGEIDKAVMDAIVDAAQGMLRGTPDLPQLVSHPETGLRVRGWTATGWLEILVHEDPAWDEAGGPSVVNLFYVRDACVLLARAGEDRVEVSQDHPLSPMMLQGEGQLHVVMPMRDDRASATPQGRMDVDPDLEFLKIGPAMTADGHPIAEGRVRVLFKGGVPTEMVLVQLAPNGSWALFIRKVKKGDTDLVLRKKTQEITFMKNSSLKFAELQAKFYVTYGKLP